MLLKYFQWEGRFPEPPQDIPRAVAQHIAHTLTMSEDRFCRYDLEGRTARYHKEQIRHWTGFRPGTTTEAEAVTAWVCAHTRVDDATISQLTTRMLERYKARKIEPPTPQRLERFAHSALRQNETPRHRRVPVGHPAPSRRHSLWLGGTVLRGQTRHEELLADFKRVTGKTGILFHMAEASLEHPKDHVDEVSYPVVGEQTLRDLVKEYHATGRSYREKVHLMQILTQRRAYAAG